MKRKLEVIISTSKDGQTCLRTCPMLTIHLQRPDEHVCRIFGRLHTAYFGVLRAASCKLRDHKR